MRHISCPPKAKYKGMQILPKKVGTEFHFTCDIMTMI